MQKAHTRVDEFSTAFTVIHPAVDVFFPLNCTPLKSVEYWQFPLIGHRIDGFLAIHIDYRRAGCHSMQNSMEIDAYFLGKNFLFKIVMCS